MLVCSRKWHLCTTTYLWKPEDSLYEPFLLFHHVGFGDQTEVFRLGGKCLYCLSNLIGCVSSFISIIVIINNSNEYFNIEYKWYNNIIIIIIIWFYETGFLCAALAVLKFSLQTTLALNSWIYFCLPREIEGVLHHTWCSLHLLNSLSQFFFLKRLCCKHIFLCVCLCSCVCRCLWSLEEGIEFFGTGVLDSCRIQDVISVS